MAEPVIVTLQMIAEGGGTVTPATETFLSESGQPLEFDLTATDGRDIFIRWIDGHGITVDDPAVRQTKARCTVPTGVAKVTFTITGYFAPEGGGRYTPPYPHGTIQLEAKSSNNNAGSVTPKEAIWRYGVSPPQSFQYTITASPNAGYAFAYWLVTYEGTVTKYLEAEYLVSSIFPSAGNTEHIRCTAYFLPLSVRVTLDTAPNNVAYGTTKPSEAETKYSTVGGKVGFTVKAEPKFGYRFVKWTRDGKTVSRNSPTVYYVEVTSTYDVVVHLVAVFEPYPEPGPKPDDYPYPVPPAPYDDGRPAIEISTSVEPEEAVGLGAYAYPAFQRKTGEPGYEADFHVEAYPAILLGGGVPYEFKHWVDGEGTIVSLNRIYEIAKAFPASGTDSYSYVAVYVPKGDAEPRYRDFIICAGVSPGWHDDLEGGDVNLGYGSVSGGVSIKETFKYGSPDQQSLELEAWPVGKDSSGRVVYQDVQLPALTAVDSVDGCCRFVRWEARYGSSGEWTTVTKSRTMTQADVVAVFPLTLDDRTDWRKKEANYMFWFAAVFEISRAVLVNANASRHSDSPVYLYRWKEFGSQFLSRDNFHDYGYDEHRLFPGGSFELPFVKEDSATDPPAGYIPCEYSITIAGIGEDSPQIRKWRSTVMLSKMVFTAPADTTDFDIDISDSTFVNDVKNGWQVKSVDITYHELTGYPIADIDPVTGAGSGKILCDSAGNVLCDSDGKYPAPE